MVGQGIIVVLYGLVLGLLLGLALTRVLTNLPLGTELLFGVSATDVITFAGVTMLLGLVALVACYVPALRATKVDPIGDTPQYVNLWLSSAVYWGWWG